MDTVVKYLEEVQRKYSITYPTSFRKLASLEPDLFEEGWSLAVGNCFLYPPDYILKNPPRCAEMPAGLLPFAHENGSQFCFFFGREGERSEPPVMHWLMDTFDVTPISSSFRGFLWYQLVVEEACVMQFYDPNYAPDFYSDQDRRESKERIARISEAFNVPYEFGPKPSPDRKQDYLDLHRAFIDVDPHAAQSLCWIGKHYLDDGKTDTAEEYFQRSARTAPYLAAPHYFLAQIERMKGKTRSAMEFCWQTALCPLYLSGDAMYVFDLGINGFRWSPEETLHMEVFAALSENKKILSEISDGDPLADYVLSSEPYDEYDRADLAQKYQDMNQLDKAIREWENVLYLTWADGPRRELALESLLEIYRHLGDARAVAMHSDPKY